MGVTEGIVKKIIALIIAMVAVLISPLTVLASDITNADYLTEITITNNSTSAKSAVVTTLTLDTAEMISAGMLDAAAVEAALRTTGGVDTAFMPAANSTYPWCIWVSLISPTSSLTNRLYTKGATGGKIRYFPGATGLNAPDIDPGDNFTFSMTDVYLKDSGNITSKGKNFYTTYDSATNNITANILYADFYDTFTTDLWTDVGDKISVNTTTGRLDYDALRGDGDDRCYYDLASINNTAWKLEYTWKPTSAPVDNGNLFAFGAWSSNTNVSGYGGDAILAFLYSISDIVANGTIQLRQYDGGATTATGNINIIYGTTYYVSLERLSSDNATLSIYSDSDRISHIAGSPVSLAIPVTVTGLRYLQASNFSAGPLTGEEIGWIDDLYLYEGTNTALVTATGVPEGEHDIEVGIRKW